MTEYERGHTARIKATVSDSDDTVTDPDQSGSYLITITITDVTTSTIKVSAVTMTRLSEGVFYYDWETAVTDTVGQYEIEISAELSSKTILNRDYIDLVEVSE